MKYREEANSHRRFISALLQNKDMRNQVFEHADEALDQARKEGII